MDTAAQRCAAPEWVRAELPAGTPGLVSTLSPRQLVQLVAPWRETEPQNASVLRLHLVRNLGAQPPGAYWGPQAGYVQTGGAVVTPTPPPPPRSNATAQLLVELAPGGQAPRAQRWLTMGADCQLAGIVYGREVTVYWLRWDGVPSSGGLLLASLSPLGTGNAGGHAFPWVAECVVNVGAGPTGARTIIPPPSALRVELGGNAAANFSVDWIDRDGVTPISGFQWTQGTVGSWAIPQRAGAMLVQAAAASNLVATFYQGAG